MKDLKKYFDLCKDIYDSMNIHDEAFDEPQDEKIKIVIEKMEKAKAAKTKLDLAYSKENHDYIFNNINNLNSVKCGDILIKYIDITIDDKVNLRYSSFLKSSKRLNYVTKQYYDYYDSAEGVKEKQKYLNAPPFGSDKDYTLTKEEFMDMIKYFYKLKDLVEFI